LNALTISPSPALRNRSSLLRAGLIVLAYFFAFIMLDLLSQQYEEIQGVVAWYPPAGLLFAFLLVFGIRFGPAVTIALLVSSVFIYRMPQPVSLLFIWAFIISLVYSVAASFLRDRVRFDWKLRKLRDVAWLVFTAIFCSALLAVLSVVSSALSTEMPFAEIPHAIFIWWIGETIGVLTITPFLLFHVMPWVKQFAEGQPIRWFGRQSLPRPTLAATGQGLGIVLIFYWVFGAHVPVEYRPLYLITLPLIWIALQRGIKGAAVAILILNTGVVFAQWLFQFDLVRLGELELIMIINCIVGLLMGAVVTERKLAEATLRQSEDKFKQLFEKSPSGIALMDRDGALREANQSLLEMLDIGKNELVENNFLALAAKLGLDSQERRSDFLERLGKGTQMKELTFPNQKGKQTTIIMQSSSLLPDSAVAPILLIINDITARKQAELENETLSRFPTENPQPILRVEQNGKIIYANLASEPLLRFWNCTVGEYLPLDWRKRVANTSKEGSRTTVEMDIQEQIYSILLVPIADHGYINLYGRDITQQKNAENELRSAKTFLDRIINTIADPVFVKDDQRQFVLVNDALCIMVGRRREELIGEDGDEMFPKEQVAVFRKVDDAVFDTGVENVNEEALSNLSTGEVRTIITRKTRYIDPTGQRFLVGIIRDITERKQAEEEIKKSEGKFRIIFDNASDGMFIVNLETRKFFMCNLMCSTLLGYSKEEFLDLDIADIHPTEDLPFIFEQIEKFRQGKEGVRSDIRFKEKNGGIFEADLSPSFLIIGEKSYLLISFKDITLRKQAESQLTEKIQELQRWYDATLGREKRIFDLKREVNLLLEQNGRVWRYPTAEIHDVKRN
jgi:PAS domain S-box-containing protein